MASVHSKGTYILILQLENDQRIRIGRLGRFEFQKGWYAYVGSAFGPGGLTARIGHHLKKAVKPHWHIDYLRKSTEIREVWVCEQERWEHTIAGLLLKLEGASVPAPGFGSSDCRCQSHLVHFREYPDVGELKNENECAMGSLKLAF
ncbi:MAG: GIY-YIG nuclease family protein [Thermodesulfobacteriota bacterium]